MRVDLEKNKPFSPPLDLTVAHRGQQRAAMWECGRIEKGPAAGSQEAVSGTGNGLRHLHFQNKDLSTMLIALRPDKLDD